MMGSSIIDDDSDKQGKGIKIECNLSRKDKKKKKNPHHGLHRKPPS